nr:hypothetical protein [Tanacetum cinerariifolium]
FFFFFCEVTSDTESESNEPVKDDSSVFTTFPNPLFNNKDDVTIHEDDVPIEESKVFSNMLFDHDEINSDKLESLVESLSNHDTESDFDNPSFPRPPSEPPDAEFDFEPNSREEISVVMNTIDELECLDPKDEFDDDDYSSFMFVIYPKAFSFLLSAESENTIFDPANDVLPPSNDDLDDEVDVGELHVDNVIQNSEHEYSENEDSDLDNPLLPLPPPEPLDKEFDFEIKKEISVIRKLIVKFECINARIKFDVKNDVFKFIIFSLLSTESEDTIFDPGISEEIPDVTTFPKDK